MLACGRGVKLDRVDRQEKILRQFHHPGTAICISSRAILNAGTVTMSLGPANETVSRNFQHRKHEGPAFAGPSK